MVERLPIRGIKGMVEIGPNLTGPHLDLSPTRKKLGFMLGLGPNNFEIIRPKPKLEPSSSLIGPAQIRARLAWLE